MSIISKPSTIIKGSRSEFILNSNELISEISDAYFQDTTNWKSVTLHYKTVQGSQYKVVKFNTASQLFSSFFLVSEKSRGILSIQKIVIKDFDGDYYTIDRSQLNIVDFDIEPISSNEENYILLEDGYELSFEDSTNAIIN